MKKIAFFTVIFFAFSLLSSYSQDIIYKTDGTKEEAKVLQVGNNDIQYKKFSNQDGPVYILNKKDVVMIIYENGEFDMLAGQPEPKATTKMELKTDFTRNILNYHVFDVFYGDVTISYERIIGSGIVGILIPAGFGYAYNLNYFSNNDEWVKNLFFSGIGANFYPGGQGMWRYFVGPKFLVGYGKQSYWSSVWDEQGNYMYDEEVYSDGIYLKYLVDNGIRFTPVKNFSVAAILSVGIRFFPEADYHNEVVRPTGHFNINVSYRF